MMDELELSNLIAGLKKVRDEELIGDDSSFNQVIDTLEKHGRKINSCKITTSHTKHWCGHPLCRED